MDSRNPLPELFSNELNKKDRAYENGLSYPVSDTYFYRFDHLNKSKILQEFYYFEREIVIKLSHSSADPDFSDTFNNLYLQQYKLQSSSQQIKQKLYSLYPTYFDKSIQRFVDSQYCVSGKCLFNRKTNHFYPLITAFHECIEELGIVPNISKLILQKISYFRTFYENGDPRLIRYITFAINIVDCNIYVGSVKEFDFVPNKVTQFFDDFDKYENNGMVVENKINYKRIDNAKRLAKVEENSDTKVQIILFGTQNDFHNTLFQIQKREISKDFETLLGMRLIPLEMGYLPINHK